MNTKNKLKTQNANGKLKSQNSNVKWQNYMLKLKTKKTLGLNICISKL
jgi:hypothetical protein